METKQFIQGAYVGAPDAIYEPAEEDAADVVSIIKGTEVMRLQAEDILHIAEMIRDFRG